MHVAVQIPESALTRMVPVNIMNLDQVTFSLGDSPKRVRQLREIGALQAKRDGTQLAFDPGHVAEVAARFLKGEYDDQLNALR